MMNCCNMFHWIKFVITTTLYLFDRGSDLVLAASYFIRGDKWWGGWTTAFFVAPWLLQIVEVLFTCHKQWSASKRMAYCFNLGTIFHNYKTLTEQYDEEDKEETAFASKKMVFATVMLENVPQKFLQVYVVGRSNNFTWLNVIVIVTSFLSASYGFAVFFMQTFEHKEHVVPVRPWKANVVITTLFTLTLFIFTLSLTLFSSVHGASYMTIALYLPVHLVLIFLCVAFAADRDKYRVRCVPCLPIVSFVLLQGIFLLVANLLLSRWYVTLASVDPALQNGTLVKGVPSFVWPKPMNILSGWKYDELRHNTTTLPTWAVCRRNSSATSRNITRQITTMSTAHLVEAPPPPPPSSVDVYIIKDLERTICVTEIKTQLFRTVSVTSLVMVGYTFLLCLIVMTHVIVFNRRGRFEW